MQGKVVYLAVTGAGSGPMLVRETVEAVVGKGLAGDRYAEGIGFYSGTPSPGGGRELTLIEAEELDALEAKTGVRLGLEETRRNLTTRGVRLNDLVGKRFSIGEVLCEGVRLCEPCVHLEQLTGKAVLRPLVHRGGLRATIVRGGTIRVSDAVLLEPASVVHGEG
ncbi:MAG: MOSC domain-containing protein [Dehalococcoidia bacterium]